MDSKDEISVGALANALGDVEAGELEGLLGKGTVSRREFTSLTEAALKHRRSGRSEQTLVAH